MRKFLKLLTLVAGCLSLILAITLPTTPASAGSLGPTPQGNIVYDNPDFSWIGFSTAEWYQLEVTVNGQKVIDLWRSSTDLGCEASTDCVFVNDQSLAIDFVGDHVGSWRWRSYDVETEIVGDWSETTTFTIIAPQTFDVSAFNPSTPHQYEINYITNDSDLANPEMYRLYVRQLGSNSPLFDIWVPLHSCGTNCYLQNYDTPRLKNGTYEVWIQGYTYDWGFSPWSPGFQFTINEIVPTPGTSFFATGVFDYSTFVNCPDDPDGTGTLCTGVTLFPVVDVSEISGIVEYIQLEVRKDGGPVVFSQWVPLNGDHPYCSADSEDFIDDCNFRIPYAFERGGAYTWRVRVWDDVLGISAWTVPGGAGDPNDVLRIEIAQSL